MREAHRLARAGTVEPLLSLCACLLDEVRVQRTLLSDHALQSYSHAALCAGMPYGQRPTPAAAGKRTCSRSPGTVALPASHELGLFLWLDFPLSQMRGELCMRALSKRSRQSARCQLTTLMGR